MQILLFQKLLEIDNFERTNKIIRFIITKSFYILSIKEIFNRLIFSNNSKLFDYCEHQILWKEAYTILSLCLEFMFIINPEEYEETDAEVASNVISDDNQKELDNNAVSKPQRKKFYTKKLFSKYDLIIIIPKLTFLYRKIFNNPLANNSICFNANIKLISSICLLESSELNNVTVELNTIQRLIVKH